MATKKVKRYTTGGDIYKDNAPYKSDDQGLTSLTETMQGPKESIGDDVRARAMAAMAARDSGNSESSDTSASAPKAAPKAAPKKAAPKAAPAETKKPYIDIPKRAAGLSQYRSDAISPAESLWNKVKSAVKGTKPSVSTDEGDAYKKGGKVAGRLATRGYGIAKGGKK